MLITFAMSDAAADARGCSGIGANPASAVQGAVISVGSAAAPLTSPALMQGTGTCMGRRAWTQPVIEQHREKYAQTTRTAAANGGVLGSHPARDPVY
jgi:hypothetical protein